MVELADDLDSFFEDESVLSAVAAAENQHLEQRFLQNRTDAQDYAGKRKDQWEERVNSQSYQSHQGGYSNTDGFPEDKRRRTGDDREYRASFRQQETGDTLDSKPEGEYMAALRGSNSEAWLKSSRGRGSAGISGRGGASGYAGNAPGTAAGRNEASNTCYKCGLGGHWARDCTKPNVAGSFSSQSGGPVPELSDVPERNCPCGAGACIVLTANTEKNLGRRFYKCPLKRDGGQCTFFEWCDGGGQSGGDGGQSFSSDRAPTQDIPQIECICGGGPCVILTAKTERNNGRAFYKCPLLKDQACGFFQWCDEAGNGSSRPSTAVPSRSLTSSESPAAGACYKCGFGGHWAKDCTMQSAGGSGNSNAHKPGTRKDYSDLGGEQNPVGRTCFKCGQGGHWIRDCPSEGGGGGGRGFGGSQSYNSTRTPEVKKSQPCQKCGRQGHWSSSCPNSGGGGDVSVGSKLFSSGVPPAGGSCYKCGDSGHWANRCPVASGWQR